MKANISALKAQLKDFFSQEISVWKNLTEPEKYLIITSFGLCIFLLVALNLFADRLEIPVGFAIGTWLAVGLHLNNIQTSLDHKQEMKSKD